MLMLALLVIIIAVLYLYGTKTHGYWIDRGVKHDKPFPFVGNNTKMFLMKKSRSQMAEEMYWNYPTERVVGFFHALRPELVIRDPELVKRILITDFAHFYPRGFISNMKEIEPMYKNLFTADGDLWRLLRQRMTPAFTSGKLKAMFPLIVERAEKLQARAIAATTSNSVLDARDLMARYTTDFIGACGFGLDADSLSDEDSAFRKLGVKIFSIRPRNVIAGFLKMIAPHLFKKIKLASRFEKDVIDLVNEIMRQRNFQPSGRNDFIDMMLELKQNGTIIVESIEKVKPDGTAETTSMEMTDVIIAAQVFVFFAAGFETSSSATSFTLHQLAYNQDVQKKVQEEVDRVLAKHDNKLSYDAIKEMTYLEWTFKEGMRMFPSLGFLVRHCARKYTFEELNFTIDEGVAVLIPLQAMHNDPQYFNNPSEFRPERFSPDQVDANSNKYVYLPFGIGPRACIGERLGLMQSLAGLAALLARFTVEPAPQTLKYPKVEPKSSIVQCIRGGLPLYFRERKLAV